MKFVTQLNLIIEGIGASRNLYLNLPSFDVKDNNFLRIIDNIFVIKKFITYINDEIEQFNKKSKYQKQILYVKLNFPDEFYKVFEDNLSHREGIFNLDKLKKEFINKILELYRDKIKKINDINSIVSLNDFEYIIFTIDERFKNKGSLNNNIDLGFLIHDILQHYIISEKQIYKFRLSGSGYDSFYPYKYSPEEILNELFVTQGDSSITRNIKYLIETMLKEFYNYYLNNFKDKLTPTSFFKNFKVNKVFLKNLINFFTIGYNYKLNEKYNFSSKDLEDLKIFLQKNYNNEFSSVIEKIKNIINPKKEKTDYIFIQNVIASIKHRKQKFKINQDSKEVTWADFRIFFKNYPNLLKLFPKNKYPDDLIIYETPEEGGDEYGDYTIQIDDPIINAINNKIINAINTGQSLMKKAAPSKADFENPESIIDFILEKISNLIKNNLTDNSKYYKILEDKLK